jgi:hypothetical protein
MEQVAAVRAEPDHAAVRAEPDHAAGRAVLPNADARLPITRRRISLGSEGLKEIQKGISHDVWCV